MNLSFKHIFSSEKFRNVSKLLTANVVAQAIGILVYPIIARIFSQSDFGLLNLFSSVASVLAIVFTCQYQYAIPIEKDNSLAKSLFNVALICALSMLGITIPIALVFSGKIASMLGVEQIADFVYLIPLYAFLLAFWQILENWYTRNKAFTLISVYQLSQSILSVSAKVALGLMCVAGGLIYGSVDSILIALIVVFALGYKKYTLGQDSFNTQNIKQSFVKYKDFPLYMLPAALVNTVSNNMAVWFISPHFGLDNVGAWGMALLLSLMPVNVILDSIYQIYLQDTSARVNSKQAVLPLYKKYFLRCLLIVIPLAVVIFALTPWLVRVFLGSGWDTTATIVRCFLPWIIMRCFDVPWNFIPNLFGKQKIKLIIECVHLAFRLIAIAVGIYFGSFLMFVIAYSAVGAIVTLGQVIWYYYLISKYQTSL